MRYRRAVIPGGSFFFTLVTAERRPLLASDAAIDNLRRAFATVRAKRPFNVDAIVILPDHLHCIWTLPPGDVDFATRWRLVKTWFTKHYDPAECGLPDGARVNVHKQSVWQHRYWEHALRDEADFTRHVEYIHFNPVKHGLVASASAWQYSSFHRYVAAGLYPADWGNDVPDIDGVGHE